jgi:hypothetical protein
MKRWVLVTLSILGVLVLAAAGGFWWLTRPTEAKPFETVVDQEQADANTVALSVLADNGIEDALASVTAEKVVIAFTADAAEGDPLKLEGMMLTALATAAGAADGAPRAVIIAVADDAVVLEWEADLTTFKDMVDGKITEEVYLASIVKTLS